MSEPTNQPTSAESTNPGLFSPFQRPAPVGWGIPYVEACSVDDRMDLVRRMGVDDLERVVAIGWAIQRTVLLAAERRLRKLRQSPKAK